ncbi:MAG TPA: methylated-DNA--[protein]-cysteine S-methyltransferase [Acetobacteraceae bacterium]|nr:methylated-DNA--[protein]-cysteine S-methyltransferase [Acetobacteraceae bacterium]
MAMTDGAAFFETAIGLCGIVWNPRGIAGVQLPERDERATRSRLLRRFPEASEDAPPEPVRQAIDGIRGLLSGEAADLTAVALDLERMPPFHQRVYAVARGIAAGSTLSYGEIAERLGDKSLARDVGQAMGENPWPIIVPCHRVLAANGNVGGFSAAGGVTTKLRLLNIEHAQPGEAPTLFGDLPLHARPQRRGAGRR